MVKERIHYHKDNQGNVFATDIQGGVQQLMYNAKQLEQMLQPVRCCRCQNIFDLCNVKVRHRYGDCTEFYTPCCNRIADDRQFKSMPDIEPVKIVL